MAQATTALMTVEEFERLPDDDLRRELVRGEVMGMTPSAAESGRLGARIAIALGIHVSSQDLGIIYVPEAGFVLSRDPDTVRVPDVAFVTQARASLHPPVEGCFPGPPDLAVEVVSPTDRMGEVLDKVGEYLAAGTQVVWVVVPPRREVYVYRPTGAVEVIGADGALTGDAVLPGLSIPVASLFARQAPAARDVVAGRGSVRPMAQAPTTLMTVEEFERLPGDARCELVRGETIEMTPSGAQHSMIGANIAAELRRAARAGGWGVAFGSNCGFVLAEDPGTVREPDAGFVCAQRLPAGRVPKSFFPGPPDLAVEVVSPSDSAAELRARIGESFAAGTRLVWVVYPEEREVCVYRSPSEIEVVGEGETLATDPLLPGLSLPVAELFEA